MENPYEIEQKQRRKVLIATIAMVAIILGLLIWVIIASVTSSSDNDDTQPIVATEESIPADANGATTETIVSDTKSDNQPQSTSSAAVSTVSNANNSHSGTQDLPTTGPADTALTALLAGVATYLAVRYFTSRRDLATLPTAK